MNTIFITQTNLSDYAFTDVIKRMGTPTPFGFYVLEINPENLLDAVRIKQNFDNTATKIMLQFNMNFKRTEWRVKLIDQITQVHCHGN